VWFLFDGRISVSAFRLNARFSGAKLVAGCRSGQGILMGRIRGADGQAGISYTNQAAWRADVVA
jgi:hypothetical protein